MYSVSNLSKLLALAFCGPLGIGALARCTSKSLEVVTSSGTVYGTVNGTTPGVRQFLGVPFAQPPVDELRWMPPMAWNDSSAVIDATRLPPSCPQYESKIPSLYNKDVREFFINGPTSEDCLTLSIWAPLAATHKSLPVYIYIYGGGFQTGGSSVPYQNPARWIQRTEAHIVVSIQYRLNVFGFPNAAGLDFQNLAFLDQRLAIEWVQSNIAAFGGNPAQMILWGQSAGAVSVDVQNFAYPSNPIVTGFVCDSGSVFLPLQSHDYSHSNFTFIAEHFNCTGTASQELACMRDVSSTAIEAFLQSYQDSGIAPPLGFNPIADNTTFFSNYTQRYLQNAFSQRPAIFGTNLNEGESLAPYPTTPATMSPNATTATAVTLDLFLCPAVKTSQLRARMGRSTYRYQYRGNFTNISPRSWMGAYHSSELPLIFGTAGDFRGESTDLEVRTSREMQDLWLDFAQGLGAGLESSGWSEYHQGYVEVFAGNGGVVQRLPVAEIDAVCK